MDEQTMIFFTRILITVLLVGIIGFERETKDKPAGIRTHLMIGVGSCSLMLLSIYGFNELTVNGQIQIDLSRIPSYVISGLGFIGAGAIIKNEDKVKGLTTASSIWISAGIGLLVGSGMYDLAVIVSIVIFIILYVLKLIERKI